VSDFAQRYGPWAIVAGASEGIGAEIARSLAARGLSLVLVARREGPLLEIANELTARHGVKVRHLALDLAAEDTVARIDAATRDLDVGLVVSNAALALVAPFLRAPLADLLRTIDVNCRSPLALSHVFGQRFATRGRGGILVLSSLAGLYGGPFVATYAASKAFSILLAESLSAELAPLGIDVSVCVAGPTVTPTYASQQPSKFPRPMPARAVAETALSGLGRKARVVPGLFHRVTSGLVGLLPRRAVLSLVSRQTRRYGGGAER
jgi:short-subunit dehydrogenase